jgi:hypothetical protein
MNVRRILEFIGHFHRGIFTHHKKIYNLFVVCAHTHVFRQFNTCTIWQHKHIHSHNFIIVLFVNQQHQKYHIRLLLINVHQSILHKIVYFWLFFLYLNFVWKFIFISLEFKYPTIRVFDLQIPFYLIIKNHKMHFSINIYVYYYDYIVFSSSLFPLFIIY